MTNFEYIDFLPDLPEEIIEEILALIADPINWVNKESNIHYEINKKPEIYQVFQGTENLYKFIHRHLDSSYIAVIQVIKNKFPIHIDIGRSTVFNYAIQTGGDNIYTSFYVKGSNGLEVQETHKIEPRKWHKLNVKVLHDVSMIPANNMRVMLSVFQRDEDNPFKLIR